MPVRQISREELYEMVWTMPMIQVAANFGISDVGMAKVCRRLNVPVPGRGYWARISAGAKLVRKPLPKQAERFMARIVPTPLRAPPTAVEVHRREEEKAIAARFASLVVPSELTDPHRFTVLTRKRFETIQKKLNAPRQTRRGEPDFSFLNRPQADFGRYTCDSTQGFPMVVSLEHVDRGLNLLDTLAKALEGEGFRLVMSTVPNSDKKCFQIQKDGERMGLNLRERYSRRASTPAEIRAKKAQGDWFPDRQQITPNGRYVLTVMGIDPHVERNWNEDKVLLEDRLPQILTYFVQLPDLMKERRVELKKQEELRAIQEQERLSRERLMWQKQMEEEEARKEFEAAVEESQRYDALIAFGRYLDLIERTLIASHGAVPDTGAGWLARMRNRMSASNPLGARINALTSNSR